MSIITTEAGVRGWLENGPAGKSITYFRGFLALAKEEGYGSQGEASKRELLKVADYMWKAAQHGRVHLVQVRHGAGDYTYLAIARGCRGEDSRKTSRFAADTVESPT